MTGTRISTPPVVLRYGLLGVVPFLAPALIGLLFPGAAALAGRVLSLYGGLILSFLGGARWGFANTRPVASVTVISTSMLPTLIGLALLTMPPGMRRPQLLMLALALGLHWLWDITSEDLPPWYPALRSRLTGGAIAGLVAGAFIIA